MFAQTAGLKLREASARRWLRQRARRRVAALRQGAAAICRTIVRHAPLLKKHFAMIYRFDTLTSTNDEARAPKYRHGDIVWAERQTAGRGQRGHTWISPEGENLTFTLVAEPRFLAADRQFLLLEAIAAALCDTFADFGIDTRIKWTNDIYHGDRKLVGILIEHFYAGATLARTVIGIGININQTAFDPPQPHPVSMRQIAGRSFDRGAVLAAFERRFAERYALLERGDAAALDEAYRARLYRLGCEQRFRLPDGTPFTAVIEGVRTGGELVLRRADGTCAEYRFREVEFVIEGR